MQAPAKPDLPILSVDKMAVPDGILFGLPTRFGTMPAQMKALLDASGALWAKGALSGKFAGTFFSTASQHGGQETTALTAVTYFSHHGMMYVPFGYANTALYNNDEVVGGSAYGAGTVADGDGSRQPTQLELGIAKNQGENFGVIVNTFVKGRHATEAPDIRNKSAAVTDESTTMGTEPTATATTVDTDHTTGAKVAGAGAVATGAGAGAAALAASKSHGDASDNAAPTNAANGTSGKLAKNALTGHPTDATDPNTTRTADNIVPTNETPKNVPAGIPKDATGNTAIEDDTIGHVTKDQLNAKDAAVPTADSAPSAGAAADTKSVETASATPGAGTTTAGTANVTDTPGAGAITADTANVTSTSGAGATTADTANVTSATGTGTNAADKANVTGAPDAGTTTAGTTDAGAATANKTAGTGASGAGTAAADGANADTTAVNKNQKNAGVNESTNAANTTSATNPSKDGVSAGNKVPARDNAATSNLKETKPKKKKWFCCG